MLKKRIIPIMLLKDNRLVKGVKFDSYRDVGDPVKSAQVYSDQDADELMLINIDGENGFDSLVRILPELTRNVFMPLTLGGGVNTYEKAAKLISSGADKVVINSAAYNKKSLISKLSSRFGVQAVVVAIDVRLINNEYILFSNNGRVEETVSLHDHLTSCIKSGVGEIIIQNIEHDGVQNGFDINLGRYVNDISRVPVVLGAGSGNYSHIKEAFIDATATAVACGSLFCFTDSSPLRAKSYLSNYGIDYKKI